MSTTLRGIPVSAGVALGNSLLYDPTPPTIPQDTLAASDVEREWERLRRAIDASVQDVTRLHDRIQAKLGAKEAAIFEAHLLLLEDEELLAGARQRIEHGLLNAARAFWETAEEFAQVLANLNDSYFQARAADIYDVRARVINHLLGRPTAQLHDLSEPAVIVARDLLPSDTASFDPLLVRGIVTEQGGPTSHTAILARQLNIPAIVAVPHLLSTFAQAGNAIDVALDGSTGELILHPDEATVRTYAAAAIAYHQQQEQLQVLRTLPAITPDGVTIEVAANIGRPQDAQPALENGAGGVGLFRTEFLFLDRTTPPSEEEQVEAYRSVLQVFAGKTIIIRTLDIGGDKRIPYLTLPEESNPFLGLRGLRLCLANDYQPLFRTQVRALLLAAQQSPAAMWVMFPMVCDRRELRLAKAFLAETEATLLQEGKLTTAVRQKLRVGVMVETPAAALLINSLSREADFFSIGTNDLAQYTLASDRMNAHLAELHRPFHPAVLRSIAHIITTARAQQRWVGMCGEMAGNPRASAFLLGLGINELSMEANALNAVKQVIRATTLSQAQALVQNVLQADSADELDELLAATIMATT